jgi:hypothetical protein
VAGPLPGRRAGWPGLDRAPRADRGRSRFPEPLRLPAEGLALRTPVPSAAQVHRQVTAVAEREGWPVPSGRWSPYLRCTQNPRPLIHPDRRGELPGHRRNLTASNLCVGDRVK